MFLINSRLGSFVAPRLRGESLSRSYGRFIAEFLNASFPVHLGLLDHPTSVGLRYGLIGLSKRWFSWKQKESDSIPLKGPFEVGAQLSPRICLRASTLYAFYVQSIARSDLPTPSHRF